MQKTLCFTLAVVFLAATSFAQGTDRAAGQQGSYNRIRGLVMGSVNEMPADGFGHRPADGIRNFAQVFGHLADFHYGTCAQARGVENPNQGNSLEDQLENAAQAEVVAALEASYVFCDAAFESLTDASAAEMVAGGRGGPTARGAILNRILEHDNEMYGISTVYLRTNGAVPPASQPRPGRGGRGGGRGQ
jgi:hypothetical protein